MNLINYNNFPIYTGMNATAISNILHLQKENKNMSSIKKHDTTSINSVLVGKIDKDHCIGSSNFTPLLEEGDSFFNDENITSFRNEHKDLCKLPLIFEEKENFSMNFEGISLPISFAPSHSVKNSFKNDIKMKKKIVKNIQEHIETEDETIPEEPNPNLIGVNQRRSFRGGLYSTTLLNGNNIKDEKETAEKNKEANDVFGNEDILDDLLFSSKEYKLNNIQKKHQNPSFFNFLKPNSLVPHFMDFDLMKLKCKKNFEVNSFLETNLNFVPTPKTSNHQKNHSLFPVKKALSNFTAAQLSQANVTRKELLRIALNDL